MVLLSVQPPLVGAPDRLPLYQAGGPSFVLLLGQSVSMVCTLLCTS